MIGTYDITPVSPTTGDSLGHVGYKDIGPRPICADCGAIDECPTCPVDQAYLSPVYPGDLVYFQFNLDDNFNEDPENPTAGWYSGFPTGPNYYIKATLEFSDLESIELPSGDIIQSNNVGYEGGSYQNLVINSAAVFEAMMAAGSTGSCWRIQITTFKADRGSIKVVVAIEDTFEELPTEGVTNGALGVAGGALYSFNNGAWVGISSIEVGQIVQLSKNGQYYQWDGESWSITTPDQTTDQDAQCYTQWHKFVRCEDTILIEGIFGFKDCQGRYYGITQGESEQGILPFRDRYRIEASFEMTGITTDRTTNENDVVTEFKQLEQWLIRNTKPFPNQVIRKIANTTTAAHLVIEDNVYVNPGDLTKINAEGLYWYTSLTVERELCDKPVSCDDVYVFNPIIECEPLEPISYGEVTIVNSDDEFIGESPAGSTFVLPDTTLEVYLDEVLEQTVTFATLSDITINVNWN